MLSGTLDPIVSHHSPVFCYIDLGNVDESVDKPCIVQKYDYQKPNLDKFVCLLEQRLSDPSVFDIDCEGFEKFTIIMKEIMDESFKVDPSKVCSRRNRLINPWITAGIIKSIEEKISLYNSWKNTVTKSDKIGDPQLYNAYSDFRRTLKNIIIQAKRLHTYKKFQSAEGNCKKTWQLINELRGKSSKATKPYFIINGDIIVNRRKIADEFNKYFLSIATELNADDCVSELGLAVKSLPQFTNYLFKPVCST